MAALRSSSSSGNASPYWRHILLKQDLATIFLANESRTNEIEAQGFVSYECREDTSTMMLLIILRTSGSLKNDSGGAPILDDNVWKAKTSI